MKKTLLFISLVALSVFSASAQITITSADIVTPNHVIYQANDTLPNISEGTAGATSQIWNMTALAQHTTDTLNVIPYAWQPNVNFPSSNIVLKQGWQNQYAFGLNNASSFSFLGNGGSGNIMGTNVVINQVNTPAEIAATFPFTLNSNFVNDYTSRAQFYYGQTVQGLQVDSVRSKSIVHKTVVVDAWGSLTTPLGTYSVIRSKETKITTDSLDAYIIIVGFGSWNNVQASMDSVTTYSWWANGIGLPLVTATMDSIGDVNRVSWLQQLPAVGINEYTEGGMESVFPNPAENEINFVADASKQQSIQIFDIAGRMIDSFLITNEKTTVNTSAYSNGLYTYSVIGKDNSVINRGKFTVNK